MILKQLLNNWVRHNKLRSYRPLYRFCTPKEEDDGDQQEEVTTEFPEMPEGKSPVRKPTAVRNKERRQWEPRTPQQKSSQFPLVGRWLGQKPDLPDLSLLSQNLKQVTNNEEIKREVKEFEDFVIKKMEGPVERYEKALSLSLQTFTYKEGVKIITNPPSWAYSQDLKKLLLEQQSLMGTDFSLDLIKGLYFANFFKGAATTDYIPGILHCAAEHPERSFILNLIYVELTNIPKLPKDLSANCTFLERVVELLSVGELKEVNPLKLYWSALKIRGSLMPVYCPLLLKELVKIKVNQKRAQKQFKSLIYFYLGEEVSLLLLTHIFEKSTNLTQLVEMWMITMVALSKLKTFTQNFNNDKVVLSLNDLFNASKTHETYLQLLVSNIPSILNNKQKLKILQFLNKAITHFQNQPETLTNLVHSQLQSALGFSLSGNKKAQLQYVCYSDPHQLVFSFLKSRQQKIFDFPEHQLVNHIYHHRYHKALTYCIQNFLQEIGNIYTVTNYLNEASSLNLKDKDSKALYALKCIFADTKFHLCSNHLLLTEEKLRNVLGEFKISSFDHVKRSWLETTEYHPKKKFFGGGPPFLFSTTKNEEPEQEKSSKEEKDLNYEAYLRTLKEVEQMKKTEEKQEPPPPTTTQQQMFDFSWCKTAEDVETEFKKHVTELNEQNFPQVFESKEVVPVIGTMAKLLQFNFMNTVNSNPAPQNLKAEFQSSNGVVTKDYGEYLRGCIFMFPLPHQLYLDILNEQTERFHRQKFKKVMAHILLFKKELDNGIITLICDICRKFKIGFTLLEILNLISVNAIKMEPDSLRTIIFCVQTFTNMEFNLMGFLKKYSAQFQFNIQAEMFGPQIRGLTREEEYKSLNAFVEVLKEQFKPREYLIDQALPAKENIQKEQEHKLKELQRANKELFSISQFIAEALKPHTTIPEFIPTIYELYLSRKTTPMKPIEYGIGLILYGQVQEKFVGLLELLKKDPNNNTLEVMEAAIRSLSISSWKLKNQVRQLLKTTLYENGFELTEKHLKDFGLVFKSMDMSDIFRDFLEYVLKTQPKNNQEIKNLYYKILNNSSDDQLKGKISALLDFIYNPKREKERIEHKKIKIEEDRKAKIFKEILSQKTVDTTYNQPEEMPTADLKDAKQEEPLRQGVDKTEAVTQPNLEQKEQQRLKKEDGKKEGKKGKKKEETANDKKEEGKGETKSDKKSDIKNQKKAETKTSTKEKKSQEVKQPKVQATVDVIAGTNKQGKISTTKVDQPDKDKKKTKKQTKKKKDEGTIGSSKPNGTQIQQKLQDDLPKPGNLSGKDIPQTQQQQSSKHVSRRVAKAMSCFSYNSDQSVTYRKCVPTKSLRKTTVSYFIEYMLEGKKVEDEQQMKRKAKEADKEKKKMKSTKKK